MNEIVYISSELPSIPGGPGGPLITVTSSSYSFSLPCPNNFIFCVCREQQNFIEKSYWNFIYSFLCILFVHWDAFFCMKNRKKRTNQPTTANWTVNADFQLQMFSCCVLLSGNNKKQLLSDCFVLNFGCHCIVLSPDGEMCNIILKTLEHRVIMKAVAVKIFYCKIR